VRGVLWGENEISSYSNGWHGLGLIGTGVRSTQRGVTHLTFIDTPNFVLEDRVQYSTVHIQKVF
jgi:hypothetical protein